MTVLGMLFVCVLTVIVLFSSVCDPVMGDEGKLYVPPELVSVYREKVSLLIPLLKISF